MERLTKEQVQFIDDYLYNQGVHYIDVRYEMTDHVATALENMEGGFRDNFSAYMRVNLMELLATNKKFKRKASSEAWKLFMGMLQKPSFMLAVALGLLLAFVSEKYMGIDVVSDVFMVMHLIVYASFYFCWIYFWAFKKNRYSVIDKLLMISFFLPMTFRLNDSIEQKQILLVFYSLYTGLITALLLTVVQIYKKYRLRFNG